MVGFGFSECGWIDVLLYCSYEGFEVVQFISTARAMLLVSLSFLYNLDISLSVLYEWEFQL